MASLELLRVSHNVEGRVIYIGEGVQGVGDKVQEVGDAVQNVQQLVQDLDDKVDKVNRESSPKPNCPGSPNLQIFSGSDLRERLRIWLTPPNPSVNHNIACNTRHQGSAQWFFRGSIFSQWKSTGPLLWVHGKRVSVRLLFLVP